MYFEVTVFIGLVHFQWQSQNKIINIVILVLLRVYENLDWTTYFHDPCKQFRFVNLIVKGIASVRRPFYRTRKLTQFTTKFTTYRLLGKLHMETCFSRHSSQLCVEHANLKSLLLNIHLYLMHIKGVCSRSSCCPFTSLSASEGNECSTFNNSM